MRRWGVSYDVHPCCRRLGCDCLFRCGDVGCLGGLCFALEQKGAAMTLRNSSQYDTKEVRALVRFATSEVDMRGVHVNVKGAKVPFRGMAYEGVPMISNAPAKAEYLVTVGIGAETLFPTSGSGETRSARWPKYQMENWREALIVVAAHEAKHIEQFRTGDSCSEIDCERFAVSKLEEFRSLRRPAHDAIQLSLAFESA